jgi:uncharacterized protein (TIGR02145 family)
MRTLLLALFAALPFIGLAQSPALVNYQGAMRDAAGNVMANQNVALRFTIHMDSANGPAEWQETQSTSTSSLGLVNVQLGSVNPLNEINWAAGNKFLQVELINGSNFTDLGTQAMLSVPYALYAANGVEGISNTGDTLFLANGNTVIIPGISDANSTGAGCIYAEACNYNPNATSDDGSCHFPGDACNDGNASTIGDEWTVDCVCAGSTSVTGASSTCGGTNVHNPELVYGTVTDQQGNVYRTIQIGLQEWMAENLKTTIYRNGDPIPGNLNDTQWASTTEGAWAFPGGGSSLLCPFGRLYNGYVIDDERGVCPTGWHVPSSSEYLFLAQTVSQIFQDNSPVTRRLRSGGTIYWSNPESGDNSSGFSALAAGQRGSDSVYGQLLTWSYFWNTTLVDTNARSIAYIPNYAAALEFGTAGNNYGFSIRCLRD